MAPFSQDDQLLQASPTLVSRECDEGVLVFDESSGKTSLLNHQGARVLHALDAGKRISLALVKCAAGMDKDCDRQEFQFLISSLENSGLIVRC